MSAGLGKVTLNGNGTSSLSKAYSIDEVSDMVESEGLGYAVQSYLSADDIADDELRELWRSAGSILDQIEEILGVGS